MCSQVDHRVTSKEQTVDKADQPSEECCPEAGNNAQAERQHGDLCQRQLPALLAVHQTRFHKIMISRLETTTAPPTKIDGVDEVTKVTKLMI